MKTKLFTALIALLFFAFAAEAQFASKTGLTSAGVDSLVITNAGTGSLEFPLSGPHAAYNVEFSLTETSGTGAGTAQVRGKNCASCAWYNIGSAVTIADVASQTGNVAFTGGAFKIIGVYFSGATTVVYRARAKIYTADY